MENPKTHSDGMGPSAGWIEPVRLARACLGVLRLDWRPQEGCGGFFLLPDVKTIKVYQKSDERYLLEGVLDFRWE